MNILYLTNHLNIGGITSYVLSLAKGFKERGHNIYVGSSGGELLPEFIKQGITFIPLPIRTKSEVSPKIAFSLFKVLGKLKQYQIDIVHTNSRTTQVLGCLINIFSHKRHISTCHGFFKKRLSRKIFACWGEMVIAISEPVKEHLMKDFQVAAEKIRLIHSGIDVSKFRVQSAEQRAQKRKDLGLGAGPVIGIIARLSDVKGHIYLIEAMPSVLNKIPQAQLLIVGEGKMKEELLALTKRLGIENNVYFIPRMEDTAGALSIMDVFVMSSLKEGLGLGLMEAMAAGLAVVGSAVGGIKSLIQDGYNGLLVEPANSKQLSCAILELLQDKTKAQSLGGQAGIFIRQNFSQEKMVLETEKAYLECLSVRY
jgi:glycosyltransferase involved in cell wall biosynthesis